MKISSTVASILNNYSSENVGVKTNLARILMQGKLAGSGKLIILPVDQGFEHGPARSFAINSSAYDPTYHHRLAIDAGISAYAAPLGMLEASSNEFVGQIPTILKINSSNSLASFGSDQAVTASVDDALRLGCSAIGFTIYPGSEKLNDMLEEYRDLSLEAKSKGLACILWSYARGPNISKDGETALDTISYAAHIAALMGANIIKVKLPSSYVEHKEAQKAYNNYNIKKDTLSERVKHIVDSCFNGKRLVIFSGGPTKDDHELFEDIKAIREGGGNGSIIGRNTFQRSREDSIIMLNKIMDILLNNS